MTIRDFLDALDIVGDLSAGGATQADDSPHVVVLDKRNVVKRVGLRWQRNHPQFTVRKSLINPKERGVPVEPFGQRQRDPVLPEV